MPIDLDRHMQIDRRHLLIRLGLAAPVAGLLGSCGAGYSLTDRGDGPDGEQ